MRVFNFNHFSQDLFIFSADDYDKLEFGTAELVVLISGPVVFVSLIFMIGFFAYYQYQHRRPRGYMAPEISGGEVVPFVQPGSESLREMMFDYSGSGSGMFYFYLVQYYQLPVESLDLRSMSGNLST